MNVAVRNHFDLEMRLKNANSPLVIITCKIWKIQNQINAHLVTQNKLSSQTMTNTLCANIMATLFDVAKMTDEPNNAGMHTIE